MGKIVEEDIRVSSIIYHFAPPSFCLTLPFSMILPMMILPESPSLMPSLDQLGQAALGFVHVHRDPTNRPSRFPVRKSLDPIRGKF